MSSTCRLQRDKDGGDGRQRRWEKGKRRLVLEKKGDKWRGKMKEKDILAASRLANEITNENPLFAFHSFSSHPMTSKVQLYAPYMCMYVCMYLCIQLTFPLKTMAPRFATNMKMKPMAVTNREMTMKIRWTYTETDKHVAHKRKIFKKAS